MKGGIAEFVLVGSRSVSLKRAWDGICDLRGVDERVLAGVEDLGERCACALGGREVCGRRRLLLVLICI